MTKIKTDAKMSVAIKQDAVPLNDNNVANVYIEIESLYHLLFQKGEQ